MRAFRPAGLAGAYTRVFLWYLLGMGALWAVGIEGIYGSPMPFYALLFPAEVSFAWHLPVLLTIPLVAGILPFVLHRLQWFETEPTPKQVRWILIGMVALAILFSVNLAVVRGGLYGVSQAYERHGYEYISDIGCKSSIRALFADYLKVRPYLSMHAKVHPPGPIALLWVVSLLIGQEPLPLSIATIVLGSLSLIPLYFWASELMSRRAALTACLLFVFVPSIALFTATSADILFMPFTLTTLYLFTRAIRGRDPWAVSSFVALAAGVFYGLSSLLSFSLIGMGAFFGLVGLWRMTDRRAWFVVIRTAVLMAAGLLAVHVAVRAWSGFDVVECFKACKAQFDLDQANLDQFTPRYPAWVWRIANPICWIYFAGIPVSVLFVRRLICPAGPGTRGALENSKAVFLLIGATFVVLNFLYLGRGEGERSAMYVFPFLILPAAHLVDELGQKNRSLAPMVVTVVFLAAQCWFTETVFYTFW